MSHPKLLRLLASLAAAMLMAMSTVAAQNSDSAARSVGVIPRLVSFSGGLNDRNGKPISSITGVTFLIYREAEGGAPLWLETQNVTPDRSGHYSVLLGATRSDGLPPDIFVSGEARWLAVQVAGEEEQPRISLLSVPYALKAGDAQTIGGLPPSAFVLAAPALASSAGTTSATTSAPPMVPGTTPVTTSGGTVNQLAKWDAAADITNSQIFDNGTNVGIGTSTPAAKLDVKGTAAVRGLFTLPASGTATATKGANSQPQAFTASAFNSGTAAAVAKNFRWQAEPTGNNTTNPSGTLNLLFGSGTTTPAETGLKIASNGLITFATGQTFPGTGKGTITGVTAGTDLTGGGATGNVTLNLDTTKVPQLSSANSFGAAQSITSNASSADALTITNNGSGAGINIATANGTAIFGSASGIGNTGIFGSGGLGGIGVNGFSTNSTGVLGNSTSGNGVAGQTGGTTVGTAGVYGVAGTPSAVGGGIAGVWGTSVTNVGVFGNSTNQTGALGQSGSGNGVAGYTTSTTNSGVAGINAAAGPGVYGHSTGGFGFVTDSNVNQDRAAGGWVKAIAYVDPYATGGIAVTRCFNSQQTGSAVSTPPCGITINHTGQGTNILDFGFGVNDRFVLLTNAATAGTIHSFDSCFQCTSNQVYVSSWNAILVNFTDSAFVIAVF